MVPTTTVPTAPSPSAVALAADAAVCEAALRCCESAAREARMAARMEGIDPRFDPRGRLGGKFDDEIEGARHSAPARLAEGCRELRSGEAAHADRCASQIQQLRRAFREAHAPVPSSCHVPDTSAIDPSALGVPPTAP
jgi:hypothetical protein